MKKIFIACISVMFILSASISASKRSPIVIIVNKMNITNELNSKELARIYMGRREKWPDGQRISVIDRPVNSGIRQRFYKIILNSEPTKKFFKPGSPIPFRSMVLKSDRATIRFVARIPNAIGYVPLDKVNSSVKILAIDGLKPGDEDYILE